MNQPLLSLTVDLGQILILLVLAISWVYTRWRDRRISLDTRLTDIEQRLDSIAEYQEFHHQHHQRTGL